MDRKIVGLLGGVAAITVVSGMSAATPLPQNRDATTYRDLLDPIRDPINALLNDNQRLAAQRLADSEVIIKKNHHHHHHHHHHHNHDRD